MQLTVIQTPQRYVPLALVSPTISKYPCIAIFCTRLSSVNTSRSTLRFVLDELYGRLWSCSALGSRHQGTCGGCVNLANFRTRRTQSWWGRLQSTIIAQQWVCERPNGLQRRIKATLRGDKVVITSLLDPTKMLTRMQSDPLWCSPELEAHSMSMRNASTLDTYCVSSDFLFEGLLQSYAIVLASDTAC